MELFKHTYIHKGYIDKIARSMNRDQQEKFRDRHLRQKYNLLHIVPTLNTPALSGLYLKSFYNGVKRYNLTLPSEITDPDRKFCGNCGSVHIPSVNTEIKVVKETVPEGEPVEKIQYKCLRCNHEAKFELNKIKSKEKRSIESSKIVKGSKTTDKAIRSTPKGRAKKRKQSSLNNLLTSKKKEQNSRNSSSTSLSSLTLESFMKK